MAKISIDINKCKGCLMCITVCPTHSIQVGDKINARGSNPVRFSGNGECAGCCMCAVICPDCCIEVFK